MTYRYSVLTYLFNGYENLKEILDYQDDVEYVCVTDDKNLKSDTWKVVVDETLNDLSPFDKTFSVRYNVFKYVTTDICVRIDASLQLSKSLDDIVEEFDKSGAIIGIKPHGGRNVVIDEYATWIKYRHYPKECAINALGFMKTRGFDYNNDKCLMEQTAVIQRKSFELKQVDSVIYGILMYLGKDGKIERLDQTVTSFALYRYFKNKFPIFVLSPFFLDDGKHFIRYDHENKPVNIECKCFVTPYINGVAITEDKYNKLL